MCLENKRAREVEEPPLDKRVNGKSRVEMKYHETRVKWRGIRGEKLKEMIRIVGV